MQDKQQKGLFTTMLSGSIVLVIGLIIAVYWKTVVVQNTDEQQHLTNFLNEQIQQTPDQISDTPIEWDFFNTTRDANWNKEISLRYPSNWIQKGSLDSDSISAILFFEKNTYARTCDERTKNLTICDETGAIAIITISSSLLMPEKIEYDNETRELATIDGYTATKISGVVKGEHGYVGKNNQKETTVIVENIKGIRFQLAMLTMDDTTKTAFDEIARSIDFKF